MAMTPNVPLIAWLPDADPTTPGIMADVLDMLPTTRGYASEFALAPSVESVTAGGLPSEPFGAATIRPSSFTPVLLAGTSTQLWRFSGNAVTDVTGATAVPVTSADTAWRFDAFGDVALTVSTKNPLRATSNVYTTAFAAVAGAPAARTMCVQSNFVMLADTSQDSGSWTYADGWWCSALGDHTDWTPDLATQCDRGRLRQTPGDIVRLIAYRNEVLAFKRDSVLRGVYVNQPASGIIWQWSVLSASIGLVGHDAVCDAAGVLYWLAADGFYRYAGGGVERIANAPWRWWQGAMSGNVTYQTYTQAAWDVTRRCVRWFYIPREQIGRGFQRGVALHVDTGRWGAFSCFCNWVVPTYVQYVRTPSIPDNVTPQSGALVAFDTNSHEPLCWGGDAKASTFTTGDVGDDDVVTALTGARVRWTAKPNSSQMRHYHRMGLGDALTTGELAAVGADGVLPVSHAARWHRLEFSQTGWCEMLGFSLEPPQAGRK